MKAQTDSITMPDSSSIEKRRNQRNALAASFLGWTLDAFDFFIVAMVLTDVAKDFHKSEAAVALTLTVTLAFRPVGAFIFGLMADRYGRRVPLMIDVLFYSVIEFASGLAPNFGTFLLLRALFGIGMGGEWGVGASLAMEAVPSRWRGVLSGLLQEGYAVGYLLAACAHRFVFPHFGWRAMFFIGGLPAILAWFIRRNVKESEVWERTRRKDWSAIWVAIQSRMKIYLALAALSAVAYILFWPQASWLESVSLRMIVVFAVALIVVFMANVAWHMAEGHRKLFFYLVALMTMMNFVSHGTQDMYPTFLKHRGLSPDLITIISMVGALAGGICFGFFSDKFGRVRAMVTALLLAVVMIPLWAYSSTVGLIMLGAFLIQFMVQGAWGVVPAHITELSPDNVRGFMPGFAYQCGVLIAGTVPYMEARMAERMQYSDAMALTALVVFVIGAVVVSLSNEKKGIEFGK
jgi:SHS family lactate transporter-like MFS transporter